MPINRIVILDDDIALEKLYNTIFKKVCYGNKICNGGICEYCYKFYSNAELLLKDLQKNDVVILDYILSEIRNGLDIAKIIREKFGSEIFIILYSSFIDSKTTTESERLGYVDVVLNKPSTDKLIKLITEREKKYGLSL